MKRLIPVIFILIMLATASADETPDITLLFTTDIHSNAVAHTFLINGEPRSVGGFARLKTAVDANSEEGKTLVLDSGDFSMATLYQSFTESDALELTIMDEIGYDAVALGNHDFELNEAGLKRELDKLRENGADVALLCSNLIKRGDAATRDKHNNPLNDYGVGNYAVFERNGLRIGLFSLMGKDAAQYAPVTTLGFADCVKTAKACVKALRETEKADMVVMLSHAGILPDGSVTEDADIARAVEGIDVILSGHQHEELTEPITVNNTKIVCAGTALAYLGKLEMTRGDNGWNAEYELIPLTSDWTGDPDMDSRLDAYTERLNEEYLKPYGVRHELNEVFAYSPYNFPDDTEMIKKCDNYALGALMNDAILDTLRRADVDGVRASMIPVGEVRSGLYKGPITVMDAYNVLSYGISPLDGSCGAPLVTFYLTGRELYDTCETSVSVSGMMSSAQLLMSGLKYTYSMARPIFNRVYKVEIASEDGEGFESVRRDDEKLYKVACSWTSMRSIALAKSKSLGLISIIPKNEKGEPLDTEEKQIEHIAMNENGREIKEWYALYNYIADMPAGTDGLPTIDARYGQDARFMKEDRGDLRTFFVNPSKTGWIIFAVVGVIAALFAASLITISRRVKRKRK